MFTLKEPFQSDEAIEAYFTDADTSVRTAEYFTGLCISHRNFPTCILKNLIDPAYAATRVFVKKTK